VDDDELIETAAADAAAGHPALDVAPWAGLMLIPYEPLYTAVWGMPEGVGPDYGLDSDIMGELEDLPDPDSPAWRELAARVEEGEWALAQPYYLALARHLRRLTGLPTLVYEERTDMPYAEQLARQTGTVTRPDPLEGLDVLVAVRVDEQRVAVVYWDKGQAWASGRYGFAEPEPVGSWVELGSNPAVVAGALPTGAAQVAFKIGRAPWTEPDQINRGFWICTLKLREVNWTPQLAYRDAEGIEFAIEVPSDGTPALWPAQAPAAGRLASHSRTSNVVEGDGWQVEIYKPGIDLAHAPTLLDPASSVGARELRVPETTVVSRPIVGSVLGHRHGFELAAHGSVWAAVANCGSFAVTVQGTGPPPGRLDLEPFRQE
jgi:hypothetical protein